MTFDPTHFLQFGALGLLALVLTGIAGGAWYASRWLARDFLTPIKNAHIAYLEETAGPIKEIPAIKTSIDEAHDKLDAQTELLRNLHRATNSTLHAPRSTRHDPGGRP